MDVPGLLLSSVAAPAGVATFFLAPAALLQNRRPAAAACLGALGVVAGAATTCALVDWEQYESWLTGVAIAAAAAAFLFGVRSPNPVAAGGWIAGCIAAAYFAVPTYDAIADYRSTWVAATAFLSALVGPPTGAAVRRDSLLGGGIVLAVVTVLAAIAAEGAGRLSALQATAALGAGAGVAVVAGFFSPRPDFVRPAFAVAAVGMIGLWSQFAVTRLHFEIGGVPVALFPLLAAPLLVWGGLRGPWARSVIAPWVAEIAALVPAALLAAILIWLRLS